MGRAHPWDRRGKEEDRGDRRHRLPTGIDLGDNRGSTCVDRGWPAFPRSELSGEEWTDSLASIRPVGITVSDPFDSGIDRLWSASFLIVRSLIAKGLNFAENRLRAAP